MTSKSIAPLRTFVSDMTRLVQETSDEAELLAECSRLMGPLIRTEAWLPEFCTRPHPDHYQQYLLHADPLERFSVVSFVWGPGQHTPVHDHTVWGVIGVLRGAESSTRYARAESVLSPLGTTILRAGEIDTVSPTIGDIHRVANAVEGAASISIHVYGANIGAVSRHVFDPDTGEARSFISGYAADVVPNLWDCSKPGPGCQGGV
ncbi:cysteine dioxygenase [Castellaniella sp. GW247-6E4]|uniref:cysteine dioxygenase family protein n=1 Tax=Castellaniella sp. GW247-6E4 TaxID=3140380 RepID=UPI003314E7E2